MLDPNEGAIAESPAADVDQDSSPEVLEETPSSKVEQVKEVPFNEHPRFKEVIEEKNYWKEAAMKALDRVSTPQPVSVPEYDPFSDVTAEEKPFFERVDKMVESKARKLIEEKERIFRQELDRTRVMTADMMYRNFLKENPDVVPNSPEEKQIAQLVAGGYPLEHAKKIVMFDANARRQVQQTKGKTIEKTKQKSEANLERSTTAPVNGIPKKGARSVRDVFEDNFKKLGFS